LSITVKLTEITLKNFIGIKTGLGKSKLTLNIDKLKDKKIIVILGDNGTGKSTLSSVLHPLPGTTDKRNKFIIEDKEGIKELKYTRSDGVKYICKIIYTPTKTGHTTKGFIKKIPIHGDEVELNPNGNITSYKDVLFDEMGVSDAILKLANQNDVCKGHVDMTSTERKVNMSTFLPEDIYSHYYAVVDKIYRDMKMRINILVDSIGKMHDDVTLETNLGKVTDQINALVSKRDKCLGKIKEYETRISIIEDNNIKYREKEISKNIKDLDKELSKLRDKITSLYYDNLNSIIDEDSTLNRINIVIDEMKKSAQSDEISLHILESSLSSMKERRNSLSEDLYSKELIIKDISTDYTLNELKDIHNESVNRFNELDKLISKLNTSLTKDDLIVGYDIVKNVRKIIEGSFNYDSDVVKEVTEDFSNSHQSELDSLYLKRDQIRNIENELTNKIMQLNQSSDLKDILNKRPHDCVIDNCPFIENAQKWTVIESKITEYTNGLEDAHNKLDKVTEKIEKLQDKVSLHNQIQNGWKYIETNLPIINKLPYNKEYSSIEKLLKAIRSKSLLSKCDDFDEFIEILESKDEYQDLKYKKIPSLENEIKIIETQGKIITSTKDSIKSIKNELSKIESQIEENKNNYDVIKNKLEYSKDIIETLGNFYDKKVEYNSIYDEMRSSFDELKEVQSKIDEMDEYKDKLKEKKEKLIEVEDKLTPLTRERELYKMEQLKIADHKQEMNSLNDDMYKCEIIRASLSVKDDGIPVDLLECFMESVRCNTNSLLSGAFNGALYLDEFKVDTKDFVMPYRKNGEPSFVKIVRNSRRLRATRCSGWESKIFLKGCRTWIRRRNTILRQSLIGAALTPVNGMLSPFLAQR
jgi:DNA repair exonuclease SbcCD ATPase subunit